MKNSVIRFIPFLACEFEQMESWLCHMASRVLFLESAFWLWGAFKKGAPSSRKYRVVLKIRQLYKFRGKRDLCCFRLVSYLRERRPEYFLYR